MFFRADYDNDTESEYFDANTDIVIKTNADYQITTNIKTAKKNYRRVEK